MDQIHVKIAEYLNKNKLCYKKYSIYVIFLNFLTKEKKPFKVVTVIYNNNTSSRFLFRTYRRYFTIFLLTRESWCHLLSRHFFIIHSFRNCNGQRDILYSTCRIRKLLSTLNIIRTISRKLEHAAAIITHKDSSTSFSNPKEHANQALQKKWTGIILTINNTSPV